LRAPPIHWEVSPIHKAVHQVHSLRIAAAITEFQSGIAPMIRTNISPAALAVLVAVPTTGSLNRVVRIEARPDLAASQILCRYWPLAISRYYAALTREPFAALGRPTMPGTYLLWLAEEIESGNSWELPVLLAHLVVAWGHELVTDPAKADIVLWSTGEIDADLRLRACDYRLAAKVAHSQDELRQAAAAGARIVAIAPASEDASPLRRVLTAAGAQDGRVASVDSIHAARGILEKALGHAVPIAIQALQPNFANSSAEPGRRFRTPPTKPAVFFGKSRSCPRRTRPSHLWP
jgi:hypothetical protein